ncbi:MAG: hypothetical protein ACRDAU_04475 [Clostridium sp.]
MKNIMKAGIYRILRSKAFIGCGSLCILDLFFAIIMNKVMYADKVIYGANALLDSITNNGTISIIFIVFIAMLVAEDYSYGTIKNIAGKGVSKLKYYVGNIISVMIISVVIIAIYSILITTYYTIVNGFGNLESMYKIIFISCIQVIILFAIMNIVVVAVIITKKTMAGLIIGYIVFYLPSILDMIFRVMNLKLNVELIGLNYYQNVLIGQTFELKLLLEGALVAIFYIILAIVVANFVLRRQEVK